MFMPARIGECPEPLAAAARPSSKLSMIGMRRSSRELLAYLMASSFSRAERFRKLSKSAWLRRARSRKRSRSACNWEKAPSSVVSGCGFGGDGLPVARCLILFVAHFFWITIRVMSSFCGWFPMKSIRSSVKRLRMAAAPSWALAWMAMVMRLTPIFVSL